MVPLQQFEGDGPQEAVADDEAQEADVGEDKGDELLEGPEGVQPRAGEPPAQVVAPAAHRVGAAAATSCRTPAVLVDIVAAAAVDVT